MTPAPKISTACMLRVRLIVLAAFTQIEEGQARAIEYDVFPSLIHPSEKEPKVTKRGCAEMCKIFAMMLMNEQQLIDYDHDDPSPSPSPIKSEGDGKDTGHTQ